jgi:apolipoprotein N-acyltransferase
MLSLPGLPPLQPLVCYEIIFSGAVRADGERPGVLVNLTNDAWFGETPGPYQHLHQARVRAVEEGLPLVRAANSGISVVTDGYGRILQRAPLGARATLDAPLPAAAPETMFARFDGNGFLFLIVASLLIASTALFSHHRNAFVSVDTR